MIIIKHVLTTVRRATLIVYARYHDEPPVEREQDGVCFKIPLYHVEVPEYAIAFVTLDSIEQVKSRPG